MRNLCREGRVGQLQRSELAVPASSEKFFLKAALGDADAIFLDLEDAVAPLAREAARNAAVRALNEVDWGNKLMAVRVNALSTLWGLRDVLAVARCPRLDLILLPKVETPEDVIVVDKILSSIEMEEGRENPIGIEILIETTSGLANVERIAQSSPRLEAMIFGVGDYSIDLENFDTVFGSSNPDYAILARYPDGEPARHWNDQWHFALARIANACRANGLRPIDGPYADYGDTEGYISACHRARSLGFEGKWAIHPSQVAMANKAFAPRDAQIRWARDIRARMEEASRDGLGAIGIEGVLIDQAHVKLADKILKRAEVIERSAKADA
jgi:malyl-CoA/(S)-citramalyl-CoA lyase